MVYNPREKSNLGGRVDEHYKTKGKKKKLSNMTKQDILV